MGRRGRAELTGTSDVKPPARLEQARIIVIIGVKDDIPHDLQDWGAGVLRIHFTAEDLGKTRIAPTWGPLVESLFSIDALQRSRQGVLFSGWRKGLKDRLGGGRSHWRSCFPARGCSI